MPFGIGINWALMANPANWLIVFLMVTTFVVLITVMHSSMQGGL